LQKRRELFAIETAGILPAATFFSAQIPCECKPYSSRPMERCRWFSAALAAVAGCDLVLVDPDNGIATANLKLTSRRAGKSITIDELKALVQPGRCVLVYHHQTRFRGGHQAEMTDLAVRLQHAGIRVSGALRASPWSPRLFLVLNGDPDLLSRAATIAERWPGKISWHPASELL